MPTVRLLNPVSTFSSLLTLLGSVLVLDQSYGHEDAIWWCIHLAVDHTTLLLRQYYTPLYISGLKVACLSMKRAGSDFTLRNPICKLTTHSGELHWE